MQQRSPTNQEKKGRIVTLELDQRGADDAWTTRGPKREAPKLAPHPPIAGLTPCARQP